MLITKIELKNITTHKKTLIEFQNGLNLLFGNNGTGKSTVLNMIGYVLFNYLPGKQESYVRQAKRGEIKHGMIKVWVVGLDDELYIIERTLGKSNPKIQIKYGYTDLIVPGVNNKMDLEEWVKIQLKLNPETNLSDLFKTSIGVPQGTFTQPFLETPQNRKNFFDPILKVDVYRKIWKNFLNIIKELDNDIVEIKLKKEKLEGRLEPIDEIKNDNDQYILKLKKSERQLTNIKKELELLERKNKEYKKIDDELKEKNILKDQILNQKNELYENLKSIKNKLETARKAGAICDKTLNDYEKYEDYLKEEQKLKKLNEELIDLNKNYNKLNQKLIQLKSNREENLNEISEINKQKKSFLELEKNYELSQHLKGEYETLMGKKKEIIIYEKDLEDFKIKNVEITKKIDEIEKKYDNYSELKKKKEILDNKKELKHTLEINISKLETRIKQLEENKIQSKGGICPILNEQCRNIGSKSFNEIFQKELDVLNKELKPELKKRNEIDKELKEYDIINKEINKLDELKVQLDLHKETKLEIGKNIRHLIDKTKEKQEIISKLDDYKKKKDELESDIEKFNVYKEKLYVDLPKRKKKIEDLNNKIIPLQEELKPLRERIEHLEENPEKLKLINIKLNSLKENHDLYLSNKDIARTVQELEKEQNIIEEKYNKLEKKNQGIMSEIEKISKTYDRNDKENVEKRFLSLKEEQGKILESINDSKDRLKEINKKLEQLKKIEDNLKITMDKLKTLDFIKDISEKIRSYYKIAGPKIAETLLKHINAEATNHYRSIMEDHNVILTWEDDFLIKIKTNQNEKEFTQLSGGEQMIAALAVRLAILNVLSNAEFAFFDEPTMNLDPEKRENLAKIIPRIKGFRQLFLITHDDTFEENVDNVIKFSKDDNEITQVECFTKN